MDALFYLEIWTTSLPAIEINDYNLFTDWYLWLTDFITLKRASITELLLLMLLNHRVTTSSSHGSSPVLN